MIKSEINGCPLETASLMLASFVVIWDKVLCESRDCFLDIFYTQWSQGSLSACTTTFVIKGHY